MILSLHPGFLFYTHDFEFTPWFFVLHPWFWVYTHDFEFTPRFFVLHPGFLITPRFNVLHPGFWVYTQVFWFTPMILSLHPGFLFYAQDFQFTPGYTLVFQFTPIYFKSGCKFTHFTLTNCFFQFLQLKGQKEVRTNGAIYPLKKPGNKEKRRGKDALYTLTLGVEPHGNV